jgi:hypothetical protein
MIFAKAGQPDGAGLFKHLDEFFKICATGLLAGLNDASDLLDAYTAAFAHYNEGSIIVNRMTNHMNRTWVERQESELVGLDVKIVDQLPKWGYPKPPSTDGSGGLPTPEPEVQEEILFRLPRDIALAGAQAGAPDDRIVPVNALAMRRFRTQVIEPLLVGSATDDSQVGGRLALAVESLIKDAGMDKEKKQQILEKVVQSFRFCGVRPEHPVRRVVEMYLSQ